MLLVAGARAFLRPAPRALRARAPLWAAAQEQQQKKKKPQQQKKQQKVAKGAATQASDSITSAAEDFSQW